MPLRGVDSDLPGDTTRVSCGEPKALVDPKDRVRVRVDLTREPILIQVAREEVRVLERKSKRRSVVDHA